MNTFYSIELLAEDIFGTKPCKIEKIVASGSSRIYYRIEFEDSKTSICCCSNNNIENRTFISLDQYLLSKGLPVPDFYGVNKEGTVYFLEDLGSIDLMSILLKRKNISSNDLQEDFDVRLRNILDSVFYWLVEFQNLPKNEWENLVEFPPLGEDLIKYDLQYAVDNLIVPLQVNYNKNLLEKEFDLLSSKLLSYTHELWGLMYRDFQSRNIMLDPKPRFIDFQSARFGPGIYDLVSFAWQAKAGFSQEEKNRLIEVYCKYLSVKKAGCSLNIYSIVKNEVSYWALFRVIQTLGAYGLRGLKEGKQHFIESLPLAIANLIELVSDNKLRHEFPELYSIAVKLRSFL